MDERDGVQAPDLGNLVEMSVGGHDLGDAIVEHDGQVQEIAGGERWISFGQVPRRVDVFRA